MPWWTVVDAMENGGTAITTTTASATGSGWALTTATTSATSTTGYAAGSIVWYDDMGTYNAAVNPAYRQALAQQALAQAQGNYNNGALAQQASSLTQAQREEFELRHSELRQRAEAECLRQREAEARARELLLEHLTEEQRTELQRNGHFTVVGSRSGKRYRIKNSGLVANVWELDDRRRWCAHLTAEPHSDSILAQVLWLEHDEPGFLQRANAHRY